jgi:hypothetical protein
LAIRVRLRGDGWSAGLRTGCKSLMLQKRREQRFEKIHCDHKGCAWTLTPLILVRLQVPQPIDIIAVSPFLRVEQKHRFPHRFPFCRPPA